MTLDKSKFEALAIAYLTGQATESDIVHYQGLFESDQAFRDVVAEIGVWLAPLNEETEDREPPAGLLKNIMAEIDDPAIAPPSLASPDPVPANDNIAGKWKAIAAAASFVAALSIGSHFITGESPAPNENQHLMALLSDSSQPKLMAIVYNPETGRVVARLSNITIPDDGDLQLWLIREGEGGPVSLGVLDRSQNLNSIEFDIPKSLQSGTDTLAVSLEGLGGSKSAGPEGPVLFTGSVSELPTPL